MNKKSQISHSPLKMIPPKKTSLNNNAHNKVLNSQKSLEQKNKPEIIETNNIITHRNSSKMKVSEEIVDNTKAIPKQETISQKIINPPTPINNPDELKEKIQKLFLNIPHFNNEEGFSYENKNNQKQIEDKSHEEYNSAQVITKSSRLLNFPNEFNKMKTNIFSNRNELKLKVPFDNKFKGELKEEFPEEKHDQHFFRKKDK